MSKVETSDSYFSETILSAERARLDTQIGALRKEYPTVSGRFQPSGSYDWYIAGPMSNLPMFGFDRFIEAEVQLRRTGFDVLNPAMVDVVEGRGDAAIASDTGSAADLMDGDTWGTFLSRDVLLICDHIAKGIVCLPGWEKSKGARLEVFTAISAGKKLMTLQPMMRDGEFVLTPLPTKTAMRVIAEEMTQ